MEDDKTGQQATAKEEGPRSFMKFLTELANGEVEAEGSYQLHELGKRLQEEAHIRNTEVKGKLTLTINFATDETGTTSVVYTVETKAPKRKTTPAMFWLTKGGNLTGQNPKQLGLALREVPQPARGTRTVENEGRPAREAT